MFVGAFTEFVFVDTELSRSLFQGGAMLQHQLCVHEVSNLSTCNGSQIFMMLRNHLASSSISDRALQTALQVFRCYDDCSEFHHLFTAA